jgi:hypothetical protein
MLPVTHSLLLFSYISMAQNLDNSRPSLIAVAKQPAPPALSNSHKSLLQEGSYIQTTSKACARTRLSREQEIPDNLSQMAGKFSLSQIRRYANPKISNGDP